MTWKCCKIPYGRPYDQVRDGVELLSAKGGVQSDVALFTRTTPDRRWRVLLISPEAAELAAGVLSDCWGECEAPELFEWDLVVGSLATCERLGLHRPRFRRREPSPPYVLGAGSPQTPA